MKTRDLLPAPSEEKRKMFKTTFDPNPEEVKYLESILDEIHEATGKKWRSKEFSEEDYNTSSKIILRKFPNLEGKFGNRIAVRRALRMLMGRTYESWGTHRFDNETGYKNPKATAKLYERAVAWYQGADALIGCLSDFALRQGEAAAGASHYRVRAGLINDATRWYNNRRDDILKTIFPDMQITYVHPNNITEEIRQLADEKVDSAVAKAYIHKKGKHPHKHN